MVIRISGLVKVVFVLVAMAMLAKSFTAFRLSGLKKNLSVSRTVRWATVSSKLAELATVTSKPGVSKFVFVGGKGGVGKTSSSGAIAVALSDQNLRTLVVSTDPAHSLGDALATRLQPGVITPIVETSNLWAMEIDVDGVMEEFKETIGKLNSASLADSLGVPKDIIESLGLEDIAGIFTNPPPGIDEIVALTKIFQIAEKQKFDRIIIDTAPTGHTLRLLQLPKFINNTAGKLIKFRAKITGAVESFQGLFGKSEGVSKADQLQNLLGKLENLQRDMTNLNNALKDSDRTQFVVVSIPTQLAVLESTRLVKSLKEEGIPISSIICNQVIQSEAGTSYVKARTLGQSKCITSLETTASSLDPVVEVTKVPYVDTEVRGLYGLKFFSSLAHQAIAKTATNPIDSRKLTIFGGKGGVGKTTSAASWAVQLSEAGFKTLVVSSDPAHSLGDALQEQLGGTPRLLDGTSMGGQLWAMEIDPEKALDEFRDLVKSSLPKTDSKKGEAGGFMSSLGLPDIKGDLAELLLGVEDPPPGTDEIVAMTKVISYLEKGVVMPDGTTMKFDRVVLDTAPTGHTLRMLQLPVFLQGLVKKFRTIRDKTDSISSFMGIGQDKDSSADRVNNPPKDKLADFQQTMERLESMLHSPKESEFTVVTIPTELAVAESERLLKELNNNKILVRRLIVNQVMPNLLVGDTSDPVVAAEADAKIGSYLSKLRSGQQTSMAELQNLAVTNNIPLTLVPYYDMEVRSVYGLRVISSVLFPKK